MPFDDEEEKLSIQSQKIGLKKVSAQKSIFEGMPQKPSQEDLQKKVEQIQDRDSSLKNKAAKLAKNFYDAIDDTTLFNNQSIFQKQFEYELLREMVRLAQEINSNVQEREGEGSLGWITVLLKTALSQRNKINNLEYKLSVFEKKFAELDNSKKSE